jgi:L,D-peptidoglycan transpeptidase YkuD (ErfK/YbiS/YcfS/YnhG family)
MSQCKSVGEKRLCAWCGRKKFTPRRKSHVFCSRACAAHKFNAMMPPEWRRARSKKGAACLTPAQRANAVDAMRAALARLTTAQISKIGKKGFEAANAKRTPSQRSEMARRRIAAMTPAQLSEIGRKSAATLGPEGRIARSKNGLVATNAQRIAANLLEEVAFHQRLAEKINELGTD